MDDSSPPPLPVPVRKPRANELWHNLISKSISHERQNPTDCIPADPPSRPKPIPRPRAAKASSVLVKTDSNSSVNSEDQLDPAALYDHVLAEDNPGYLQNIFLRRVPEEPSTNSSSTSADNSEAARNSSDHYHSDHRSSDISAETASFVYASEHPETERNIEVGSWEEGESEEVPLSYVRESGDMARLSWISLGIPPPCYTPPERPESCISTAVVDAKNLGDLEENPPPLPPRPPRAVAAKIVDRVALPNTAIESANRITTIYSGYLTVKHSLKDMGKRWCVVKGGTLSMFSDQKASVARTVIPCGDFSLVDFSVEKKSKTCFDLVLSKSTSKPWSLIADSRAEIVNWTCSIAKAVCDCSSMYEITPHAGKQEFELGGRVYLRQGATGEWTQAWIELRSRQLLALSDSFQETFDLRKAASIQPVNVEFYANRSDVVCPSAGESGEPFVLNFHGRSLYIQADSVKATNIWLKELSKRAKECGEALEDQPLTSEDVPVVLDKCLSFVSAYGMKSEGIYRHSGVNSRVAAILEYLAKEPTGHLSREQYSEHDVAGAVKRFLRNLPDPLIKLELYQPFIHTSEMQDENLKLLKYKTLLKEMQAVPHYATLKKILGHLRLVAEYSSINKMTTQNIAASFGRTLMVGKTADSTDGAPEASYDSAKGEITVMMDLLSWYEALFDINEKDLEKERKILAALDVINKQLQNPPRAGDFLMEIFWEDRTSEGINVPLSRNLTAGELCSNLEQGGRMKFNPFTDIHKTYAIHEVLFNDKLVRMIPDDEEVIPIIMRWTSWNEHQICDYSSNYLCVRKKEQLIPSTIDIEDAPLWISQTVKISKEKSFKKAVLEMSRTRLLLYKSATTEKPTDCWELKDICWFVGCSPQRSPPSPFTFTFIERDSYMDKAKQHRQAFGYTVACENEADLYKWIMGISRAQAR